MGFPITAYGLSAGLLIVTINTIALEAGFGAAWLGFLVMFIAFASIYVAIRNYRDNTLGGVITFGKALGMGLGIAALAGVVYVCVWEVYLWLTDYQFIQNFTEAMLESRRAAGANASEMALATEEVDQLRALYDNPFTRLPMTFLEIFPVGMIVALVSAGLLRNHRN